MNRKSMIATLMVAGLIAATSAWAANDAGTAAKPSSKSVASANKKMEASAKDVDQAAAKGGAEVAERLAKMFNTTPDALTAERKQLGTSWGQLAIAHTLAAQAGGSVTVASLIQERKAGKGWGEIANGLNLKLGQVVSEVHENSHAAANKEKSETAEKDADHDGKSGKAAKAGNASEPREAPASHGGSHGHGSGM